MKKILTCILLVGLLLVNASFAYAWSTDGSSFQSEYLGNGSFKVTWTGYEGATKYRVDCWDNGTSGWGADTYVAGDTREFIVTGVPEGVTELYLGVYAFEGGVGLTWEEGDNLLDSDVAGNFDYMSFSSAITENPLIEDMKNAFLNLWDTCKEVVIVIGAMALVLFGGYWIWKYGRRVFGVVVK